MLVRRDGLRLADTRAEIDRLDALLRRLCDQDGRDLAVEALIEAGALEAAVADALNPDRDGFTARDGTWRTVTLETAKLFRASRRGEPDKARAAAKKARKALAEAIRLRLPDSLSIETADGYAWRGLYPETYLEAAERFLASSAPISTVVVGLRGVGASLSAVVAAALEAGGRDTESVTVRAHEVAEGRMVRFDERLAGRLGRRAQAGAWFLLVDDGPGSTGASFAAAAEALNGIGARDEQIVLFPGLAAEGAKLRSAEARARWGRHRKLQVGFEAMRDSLAPGLERSRDLSRGLWREVLKANLGRPVTAPQHERRKYLSPDGATLFRYAGLGRSGRERLERAGRLAEAGFTPEPKSFADGFLAEEFVSGRSLHGRRRDPADIAHAARYLGWLGRYARTGAALTGEELTPMILRNVQQSLGEEGLSRLVGLEAWPARLAGAPAVAIDGRLAPHEWIRSERGLLKTDALDHHDDRFMPGPTDIAWDVAGFSVEWGLDAGAARDFAAAVAIEAADATLDRRLPFYETAYLAFRTGFTHEAAEALPEGSDRRGLRRQAARYRARLDQALDRMQAFG
ncbi:MAG: hypothetical protein JSR45_03585 [Proteobacteria bacterium]|nr:hypothetical protein [Pseudomonadota bacterium]